MWWRNASTGPGNPPASGYRRSRNAHELACRLERRTGRNRPIRRRLDRGALRQHERITRPALHGSRSARRCGEGGLQHFTSDFPSRHRRRRPRPIRDRLQRGQLSDRQDPTVRSESKRRLADRTPRRHQTRSGDRNDARFRRVHLPEKRRGARTRKSIQGRRHPPNGRVRLRDAGRQARRARLRESEPTRRRNPSGRRVAHRLVKRDLIRRSEIRVSAQSFAGDFISHRHRLRCRIVADRGTQRWGSGG